VIVAVRTVTLVAGLLILPADAMAQADCTSLLEQATAAYDEGRFGDALDQIDACLTTGPATLQAIRAYSLLVRIRLLQDETDAARAAATQLLRLDPTFPVRADDPPRFAALVRGLKDERTATEVTSVSKSNESLLEAPATVVVVTADEIRQRGYLDLESVLHDLPGFDISRVNGIHYSNLYQRGYRSDATSRTLLLVDGVEQNDLFSHVVDLSRQFPLSNVDRVEVIYGPASTMYGSNAFVGVINVITRTPERIIDLGRSFGASVQIGGGAWNTRYVDGTIAGRRGDAAFSLSGRLYRSDEWDVSDDRQWDYDPDLYTRPEAAGGYARWLVSNFSRSDVDWRRLAALDREGYTTPVNGSVPQYSDVTDDWMINAQGRVANFSIGLQTWRRTEGIATWTTDRVAPGSRNGNVWVPKQTALHARFIGEFPRGLTFTYFGQAKIHELGQESSQFALHSYLDGPLSWEDQFNNRPAFWAQTLLTQSSTQIRNEIDLHYRRQNSLDLVTGVELRNGAIQGNFVSKSNCRPIPSPFANVFDYRVLSFEQFIDYFDRLVALINRTELGGRCMPTNEPVAFGGAEAGEHFTVRDVGVFAQASYKPTSKVKLIGGLRFDNDHVRLNGGFGTVWNPRLGIVFSSRPSSGTLALKALYSEAFQDASSFEKYSTIPGIRDAPSPNLQPEKARNLEFAVGGQWGELKAELAGYRASYSNRVGLTREHLADDPVVAAFLPLVLAEFAKADSDLRPGLEALLARDDQKEAANRIVHNAIVSERYQNIGRQRVWGLQAAASMRYRQHTIFGNYTFTDAEDLEPTDNGRPLKNDECGDILSLGTPDIAQHRGNFGVNARFGKWNVNMRVNAVGARATMLARLNAVQQTQQCVTPATIRELRAILEEEVEALSDALGGAAVERAATQGRYAVVHAAVTYELTSRAALQMIINNLLDTSYADPGPLNADGVSWPTQVRQPPRAAFVQLITRF
jgi:outer membrane cobalamin receptor